MLVVDEKLLTVFLLVLFVAAITILYYVSWLIVVLLLIIKCFVVNCGVIKVRPYQLCDTVNSYQLYCSLVLFDT